MAFWNFKKKTDTLPPLAAESDKAPVGDVAYSESLLYARSDWPKYNPDELLRMRGTKIYAQMMLDEQVKAVVRFKRDAVTARKWSFEFDLPEKDEENGGDGAPLDAAEDKESAPESEEAEGSKPKFSEDGMSDEMPEDEDPSAESEDKGAIPGKKSKKPALTDEQKLMIRVFTEAVKQMDGVFIDALNGIKSSDYNGFSMVEKVYKQIEVDGKTWWGIKRLPVKPAHSFAFHTDEYGNIERIVQRWESHENDIDPKKFIHYVNNPDVDQHYGQSELREAYRAWFSKDMTIRFMNIHMERHASGFVWIQPKDGLQLRAGTAEYTQLQTAIQTMAAKTAMILPSNVDLHYEKPATTTVYETALAIHDKAIAKALLVPNLLGITEQGNTGSYSQSQTQLEAFLWMLDAEAARLEEALNEQLFKELGDLNFGKGPYPKFKFKPISDALKLQIIKTWNEMLKAGAVKHTDTDEAHVRKMLDFPEAGEPDQPPPALVPTLGQDPAEGNLPIGKKPGAGVKPSSGDATIIPKKRLASKRAAYAAHRAQQRVDFAVIDRRHTSLVSSWTMRADEVLKEARSTIIEFLRVNDVKANPDIVQDIRFSARDVRRLNEVVRGALGEAWGVGIDHAQREISKAKGQAFAATSPLSGAAADKFMEARAYSFAGDISDTARKKITTILYNGIKGDWTLAEMISKIEDEIDTVVSPQMATAIRTVTFEAINEARYDFFTQPELGEYVQAFEYSAILDGRTTEVCEHMDGRIYRADSSVWESYTPPNHFNCRSLLIPITADDTWSESAAPEVEPQEGFGK